MILIDACPSLLHPENSTNFRGTLLNEATLLLVGLIFFPAVHFFGLEIHRCVLLVSHIKRVDLDNLQNWYVVRYSLVFLSHFLFIIIIVDLNQFKE